MIKQPVVLAILDGFGISFEKRGNAVYLAKIPNLKEISKNYPGTTLRASGVEVGLSWGEMGSSEVGHTNIGAGLVVYQNLERFNIALKDNSFYKLDAWRKAVEHSTKNNSAIHIMGLLSNGGVHSHIDHLLGILKSLHELRFAGKVFLHIFTDGQDVAPQSAPRFIEMLGAEMTRLQLGEIATIIGRYYAMDRNENWDRIEAAYKCLTEGAGEKAKSPEEALLMSYDRGVKDESIRPTVILNANGKPKGLIKGNDSLIFFNFRADRARQITKSFVAPDFNKFSREKMDNLFFVSMTQYGTGYLTEAAFPPEYVSTTLAKVISDNGGAQLHIAEKEKYAHVTYFFNGGVEKEFPGEDRIIIKSKPLASYDLDPAMSAREIADRVVREINPSEGGMKYNFIVVNFANGDVVGHTGNMEAGIKSVEVLDECIGKLKEAVLKVGGSLVLTADHGNVEEMINLETGEIDKEHSTNPVPLWIISPKNKILQKNDVRTEIAPQGILADVAPTILEIMEIPKPKEMSGTSLLSLVTTCPLLE